MNDEIERAVAGALRRVRGIGLECFVSGRQLTWWLLTVSEPGRLVVERLDGRCALPSPWRRAIEEAAVIYVAPHDRVLDQDVASIEVGDRVLGDDAPILVLPRLADLATPLTPPGARDEVWMHGDEEDEALRAAASHFARYARARSSPASPIDDLLAAASRHTIAIWFCHGDPLGGGRHISLDLGLGRRLSELDLRAYQPDLRGREVLLLACQRPGVRRPGGRRSTLGFEVHRLGAELVITANAPITSTVAAALADEYLAARRDRLSPAQAWLRARQVIRSAHANPAEWRPFHAIGRGQLASEEVAP